MRTLRIIPRDSFDLYAALVRKEIGLARKKQGTFYRSGRKKHGEAKWAHEAYSGWVSLQRCKDGVVIAEIQTRARPSREWELLHPFLGFLERHFGNRINAINILFLG
ncbi:MAG: hypothetical protein A2139_14095 [Desulfobacca sp. RBG_16_60_12]|nr:MAG: hypothetical protein A2139_14095 [Desulfobacca sp. RBG_16_60_12]